MRVIANIAIVVGFISLVAGIISRLRMQPITLVRGGLEAQSMLSFTIVCFIIAITFLLLELAQSKK